MALYSILIIVLCAHTMRALGDYSQQNITIDNHFDAYYTYKWGTNHFSVNRLRTEAQLEIDKSSGAGFRSKLQYGSGVFHIKLKIPKQKTDGIITTFYLTSLQGNENNGNHCELDFEFIGTKGDLQTNVFNNDGGNREQKIRLWFDPSEEFHTYGIIWNPYQIVFFVDWIPIRVFKNNAKEGITFPSVAMHVEASLWNASWAGKVDWSKGPFFAQYSDFGIQACSAEGNDAWKCASDKYFWNGKSYKVLNGAQEQQMRNIRRKFMIYDYCWKESTRKKECAFNV